jgi:hypothetical protein
MLEDMLSSFITVFIYICSAIYSIDIIDIDRFDFKSILGRFRY